jgi:hypothetical protein
VAVTLRLGQGGWFSLDGQGGKVLKSEDGGVLWSQKTVTGLTTPALVAVAPDDDDLAVVVGDSNEVYVTTDVIQVPPPHSQRLHS